MRRTVLAVLGLLLLAGAVALEPPATATGGSGLEALGRSLGGWRVVAVNALFLRAEALRAAGRTEELFALYQALVELDPDNDAAIDALAREQVENLLPTAPTLDARVAWWNQAWRLTERGLAANPRSARLMFRAADLLLEQADRRPGLDSALDRAFGGSSRREALGLSWLLAAARTTGYLPKVGRLHLIGLARAAPLLAARALRRGDPPAHVAALLSAAEDLQRMHGRVLPEIVEYAVVPPGLPPRRVPLDRVLEASIAAVRAALSVASGASREPLDAALAAYVEAAGETELAAVLRAWAQGR